MSTPVTSGPGKSAKKSILQLKISYWLYAVLGLIMFFVGLLQIYNGIFPDLPTCTSDTANNGIHDLFKAKDLQLTSLTNEKTLTNTSSQETCQADFMTPAEAGTLYYRIYWKSKSPQIQITKVDTHPR